MRGILVDVNKMLPTQKIRGMSMQYIEELATMGYEDMPVVYFRSGKYYIIDGHHRVLSQIKNKRKSIECIEISGDDNEFGYKVGDYNKLSRSDYYDWEDVVKGLKKSL